jgi:hypothetical protein
MPIANNLPTRQNDGITVANPNRADAYQGAWVTPLNGGNVGASIEGSYFVAITPTSGTGIIGHAAPTTFDATKPYICLYNSNTNGKYIYPQFVMFNETVASVGGTVMRFVPVVDAGNRYSSAGTAMTVANTNGGSTVASGGVAYCGAVLATAATGAARNYGDIVFRGTTIDIIGDNYTIVFGAPNANGGATSKVATLVDSSRVAPPIAVAPGQSFLLHQWAASQSTGPTFQVVFGWIER